jgi:hypothetical protein
MIDFRLARVAPCPFTSQTRNGSPTSRFERTRGRSFEVASRGQFWGRWMIVLAAGRLTPAGEGRCTEDVRSTPARKAASTADRSQM